MCCAYILWWLYKMFDLICWNSEHCWWCRWMEWDVCDFENHATEWDDWNEISVMQFSGFKWHALGTCSRMNDEDFDVPILDCSRAFLSALKTSYTNGSLKHDPNGTTTTESRSWGSNPVQFLRLRSQVIHSSNGVHSNRPLGIIMRWRGER